MRNVSLAEARDHWKGLQSLVEQEEQTPSSKNPTILVVTHKGVLYSYIWSQEWCRERSLHYSAWVVPRRDRSAPTGFTRGEINWGAKDPVGHQRRKALPGPSPPAREPEPPERARKREPEPSDWQLI